MVWLIQGLKRWYALDMGKLYVVATPIGNLKDITLKAIEVLKLVDLIASEDTRKTQILTNFYNIKTPLTSFHEHTPREKIERLLEGLKEGKNIAIVTEAGTPGVADPGGLLISEAVKSKIEVVPIPGPSAITAALSVSGFLINDFLFLGYFPKKKGRQTLLQKLQEEKRSVVFFESPQRILKTLNQLEEYLGPDREAVVCRELTKKFETVYRGKIREVIDQINPKGEFVVIIKNE